MYNYRLSNTAKEDIIRIHHYGIKQFGLTQADKYIDSLFTYFDIIAQNPFAFESASYIKEGYRRCPHSNDSIYFKINQNTVEIMAIIGLQDSKNIL